MWQRMLMTKNPKVIAKTAAVSGTISLWIITFSALLIGGIGSGLILELPEGTAADGFMTILYAEFFPVSAIVITVAAFAAGMLAISSQILTTSSVFVQDIVKKPFRPDMDNETEARVGRYFIMFFSLVVLLIALGPAAEQATYDVETWEELEQSLADGSLSSDKLYERRDVITRWEENLEDRRLIKHSLALYSDIEAAREQRVTMADRVTNEFS
jgi:hypothetical protein